MKDFPRLIFLTLLIAQAVRADLASKIRASAPDAKLSLDAGDDPQPQTQSNLDIDAFFKFSQQYSTQPKAEQSKPTKTLTPSSISVTKPSMNLADIAKNRRLNNGLLSGLPIMQPLSKSSAPSSGIQQFDEALFSTDSLPPKVDAEQGALKSQIQQISDSMRKFKSANLKYLNSIDIESKNAQLFLKAQENITNELLTFRNQLDGMRAKARSVKEEKNAAVLELEELVNQRAAKLRQVADLTQKNDELNAQYAALEKQIGAVEAEDSQTEGQIRELTQRQDAIKKQFDGLTLKYNEFQDQKVKAQLAANDAQADKSKLVSELKGLTQKIVSEEPINEKLKQDAVAVDQEISQVEAEILKYQQESALLDRQLHDLDGMKQAALANLGKTKGEKLAHETLKHQVKTAQEQAGKKQSVLSSFEHDIKAKERSCRCSQRQLSKIVSEKQLALNSQQAIEGLMSSIQLTAPGQSNMKLLNSLMSQPALQVQAQSAQPAVADPSKLSVFSDPYFQQSSYFKGD